MRIQILAKIRAESHRRARCEKLRRQRERKPEHSECENYQSAVNKPLEIARLAHGDGIVDDPSNNYGREQLKHRLDELEERAANGFAPITL